jgi:hypothetical protein
MFTSGGKMDVDASANGILLCGATVRKAQLSWVDRTGKHLGSVGATGYDIAMFRLSPDARHSLNAAITSIDSFERLLARRGRAP